MKLLEFTDKGIYCAQADIYIDPNKKVKRALITHGHADHAKGGHQSYLCHRLCTPILKLRLGKKINVQSVNYNEIISINGVDISFHPAGHIIGSSQIRLAYKGEIWVASGDYKIEDDGLAEKFEPIKCHYFITECTFALPVYKWRPQNEIYQQINQWWSDNKALGITSIIVGYSLGKSQRILHHLDPSIGKIYTHNTIENVNKAFRDMGVNLTPTTRVTDEDNENQMRNGIIITPPSALLNRIFKRRQPCAVAMASGWMALRHGRRRRNTDRGFILSDHADWTGLIEAVQATEAQHVITTHGYSKEFAQWLREQGLSASVDSTDFSTTSNENPGKK